MTVAAADGAGRIVRVMAVAVVLLLALVVGWRVIVSGMAAAADPSGAAARLRGPPAGGGEGSAATWRGQLAGDPADHVALAMLARTREADGDLAQRRRRGRRGALGADRRRRHREDRGPVAGDLVHRAGVAAVGERGDVQPPVLDADAGDVHEDRRTEPSGDARDDEAGAEALRKQHRAGRRIGTALHQRFDERIGLACGEARVRRVLGRVRAVPRGDRLRVGRQVAEREENEIRAERHGELAPQRERLLDAASERAALGCPRAHDDARH